MQTIAETLINEERQEGRQEEAVSILLRLLRRRPGSLSLRAEAGIRKLTLPQLEQPGEDLLDFEQAADLTAWLRNQQPGR